MRLDEWRLAQGKLNGCIYSFERSVPRFFVFVKINHKATSSPQRTEYLLDGGRGVLLQSSFGSG